MTCLAGVYEAGGEVLMTDLRLPELDKNRIIDHQSALVFDADCRYDVILGYDFLQRVGIDIRYSTGKIEWFGNSIPLREAPCPEHTEEDFNALIESYLIQMEDEYFGGELNDAYATNILDAKYDRIDADALSEQQQHLTPSQREDLRVLFKRHEKLFSGKLGK